MSSPEKIARLIVTRQTEVPVVNPGVIRTAIGLLQKGKNPANNKDELYRRAHQQINKQLHEMTDLTEAEVSDVAQKVSNSKDALASQIAQALNRYSFTEKGEDRGILLLVSALVLLNASSDQSTIGTVRRLLTAGLSQMKKTNNK